MTNSKQLMIPYILAWAPSELYVIQQYCPRVPIDPKTDFPLLN